MARLKVVTVIMASTWEGVRVRDRLAHAEVIERLEHAISLVLRARCQQIDCQSWHGDTVCMVMSKCEASDEDFRLVGIEAHTG